MRGMDGGKLSEVNARAESREIEQIGRQVQDGGE